MSLVVGGALPEIPTSPWQWAWAQGWAGAVLKNPLPSLTLSLELVKTLLNEPASVKVDEVSPGGVAGGGVMFRGEHEGFPQLSPCCWVSPRVGSQASLPPSFSTALGRPNFKPQLSAINGPWVLQGANTDFGFLV